MVSLYQCCPIPNFYLTFICHLKSFFAPCLFLSAIGLWFFIRRGKQCLDFTVTVHFLHMIGCWIYNAHLPAALSWWLVNVACMALMAVIGEYLCMRTELRAIPVNTAPKSNLWGLLIDWCATAGVYKVAHRQDWHVDRCCCGFPGGWAEVMMYCSHHCI